MSSTVVRTLRQATFGALAVLAVAGSAQAVDITGAGATFPNPVYQKWAEAYKAKTGTALNYQSVGSGAGIKQIEAGTVDHGSGVVNPPEHERRVRRYRVSMSG